MNPLTLFSTKMTKFSLFPFSQVPRSNARVCHTEILSLGRCFKSAYLGKGMWSHVVHVNGKKIHCTGTESNQETHPAHSYNQNIKTTTPFNFTVTITLTIYDPLPIMRTRCQLLDHEFLEQPAVLFLFLCQKIPHRLLKIRGSRYFKKHQTLL